MMLTNEIRGSPASSAKPTRSRAVDPKGWDVAMACTFLPCSRTLLLFPVAGRTCLLPCAPSSPNARRTRRVSGSEPGRDAEVEGDVDRGLGGEPVVDLAQPEVDAVHARREAGQGDPGLRVGHGLVAVDLGRPRV